MFAISSFSSLIIAVLLGAIYFGFSAQLFIQQVQTDQIELKIPFVCQQTYQSENKSIRLYRYSFHTVKAIPKLLNKIFVKPVCKRIYLHKPLAPSLDHQIYYLLLFLRPPPTY